ncbi:hypothetical protein [Capnocytophaga canis]|uniref:hypothetical protein n=1 Tax=Capnocytophaga canis TaxID=1848903 RepID=UPI001561DFAE|nr:hypothetical protein [Capnocytophaga canis]
MTKYIVLSFAFLLNVVLSLVYASFVQEVVFQDFIDVIRPITIVISLLLGVALFQKDFKKENLIDFFISLGLISSAVVFLEKLGMSFFYELYSDFNHKSMNRATGIYYDFAELGAMQSIAIIAATIKFIEEKKHIYIYYLLIFSISIILSTSKASILLLGILFSLLVIKIFTSSKFYRPKYILSFFLIMGVAFYLTYIYVENDPLLLDGLKAVFSVSRENHSVNNRLDNIDYVVGLVEKFDLRSFIGYSASRNVEGSYIEVAFFSVLFRYGIVGTVLYYLIFIGVLFEKIPKPYNYFKYVVFATIVLDTVAAMTNRFSFPIALFILVGILISEKNKLHTK